MDDFSVSKNKWEINRINSEINKNNSEIVSRVNFAALID